MARRLRQGFSRKLRNQAPEIHTMFGYALPIMSSLLFVLFVYALVHLRAARKAWYRQSALR